MKRDGFFFGFVCVLVMFAVIFFSISCKTFHASAEKAEITVSKEI